MLLQVHGELAEERGRVHARLEVARCGPVHRVRQLEGRRRDQVVPGHVNLMERAAVQSFAQGEGPGDIRIQRIVGRGDKRLVDLQALEVRADDLPAGETRARLGQRLEPLVGRVVQAHDAIDLEPADRQVAAVHVAERMAGPPRRLVLVQDEEGVVVPAGRGLRFGRRFRIAVGAVQPGGRVDVVLVVELGGRPQRAEQQSADVRALLNEGPPRVGVGDVAADREVVTHAVRALHPDRRALIVIVGPHHVAPVVHAFAGEVEERAIVAARDRQVVLCDVAALEQVAEVIVHRRARRQLRTPTSRGQSTPDATAHGRGAVGPLSEARLQRHPVSDVVDGEGASERVTRGTGLAALGRDEPDTLTGARAIDGAARGTHEYVRRRDVVGIQIRRAIGRHRAAEIAARRLGGIVERYAVDHDQGLTCAVERPFATDPNDRR